MAKLTEYKDMAPRAKAVVEGIAKARGIDPADINNVWKALARHPDVMERFAAEMKAVMAPGKLDALTKELIYLAVVGRQPVRLLHRLARHMARQKGMTRGDARGVHGGRAGGAEGQQDRDGLSCAGRRSVRGEVT